jgi:hypothetical protein
MSTTPIRQTPSNVSTPPTVIVPYHTPPTVILDEPRKPSTFDGHGQNLRNDFAAATSVDDKIEHLETYLKYKDKHANKGGRRSKKAQRKHRKKTSKRKSRK